MDLEEAQDRTEALIQEYGWKEKPLLVYAKLVDGVNTLGRAIKTKNDKRIKEELSNVLFAVLAISKMAKIDLGTEFENKIEKDWEKCK